MKKYQFNKLVRSKIPARMCKEGVIVNQDILSKENYLTKLNEKLVEEVKEVSQAKNRDELIIELADVLEVIEALSKAHQIEHDEIKQAQEQKREINGHFAAQYYINHIEVPEDKLKVIAYLESKNRHYKLV